MARIMLIEDTKKHLNTWVEGCGGQGTLTTIDLISASVINCFVYLQNKTRLDSIE